MLVELCKKLACLFSLGRTFVLGRVDARSNVTIDLLPSPEIDIGVKARQRGGQRHYAPDPARFFSEFRWKSKVNKTITLIRSCTL